MNSLRFAAFGRLAFVSLLVGCFEMSTATQAQNTYPDCCPPNAPEDVGRIHQSYNGRTFMSFPNYTIVLSGAPTELFDLSDNAGVEPTDARVIYRNNRGMAWDGNEFFLHPNYPAEQITKYRYGNRLIDRGFEPNATGAMNVPATTYAPGSPVVSSPMGYPARGVQQSHVTSVPFTGNAWVVRDQAVTTTSPAPNTYQSPVKTYQSPVNAYQTPINSMPTGRISRPQHTYPNPVPPGTIID